MLLDTSFLVDVLRGDRPALRVLAEHEEQGTPMHLPSVALFELYRGVAMSDFPEGEESLVRRVLSSRSIVPLEKEAAEAGGMVDGGLKKEGQPIDPEDAMIAGIALARGERLLTANTKHFSRVRGLQLEKYK